MLGGRGPGGKKAGILAGVASVSEEVCSEITCKQHKRVNNISKYI